ncbi:MAG: lamin tail domain-containing protein [Candidatus Marinimicrobia bacterium]|jgi:hypothetical protein|nr:lamin tail domain-containing protein [Candidatus Neomarinimicrobiota bacterium]MDP6789867.1 lamin tail domain-containing protein [Candidatus Neomarinimicrobiota bacterium]MDP7072665.1 lamin tail domain-containing protein [Candidatus Neomarinimicrobiota bacterium]
MKKIISLLLFLAPCLYAEGWDHKFMAYNLLYYGDDGNTSRDTYFQTIIANSEPDLILATEIIGSDGGSAQFLSNVLDVVEPGAWAAATFTNQTAQQDIGLYYKTDYFEFVSTSTISTKQSAYNRDAIEFVMKHAPSGVEFRVIGVHFQASSGSSNYNERAAESTALRSYLNGLDDESHFIVAGDFNFYSSNSSGSYQEPGYNTLIEAGTDSSGRVHDPIDSPGTWHNGTSFASIHTQSPRASAFGVGVGGGMDDRFDFILASTQVMNETYEMTYVADSYVAYGNDGLRCCNGSINSNPANSVVSADVADALYYASDHLPVLASFSFPPGEGSGPGIVISEVMQNPGAVSDSYGEWFEVHNADSVTLDLNGWIIKDNGSDTHTVSAAGGLPIEPGGYLVFARNDDSTTNGGFAADYEYSGFTLGNSTDEIVLVDTAQNIVDQVAYTTAFPFASGASMYLADLSADNSASANWSVSDISYGDGDYGTPGRAWNDSTLMALADDAVVPDMFQLYPAYPNPFNPTTSIRFSVENTDRYSLHVFDITGRVVDVLINGQVESGQHEIQWNASNHASGVYWVILESGGKSQNQKVVLLK